MPLINLKETPTRLDEPSFILRYDDTDPIQIRCLAKQITHSIDEETEDVETYCNPGGQRPGSAQESIELTVYLSHGANGLFNVLHAIRGELVTFAYQLHGGLATSPDNLEMSGSVYVPAVPFSDAGVRKNSEVTLTFNISGVPIYNDTTPVSSDHSGI